MPGWLSRLGVRPLLGSWSELEFQPHIGLSAVSMEATSDPLSPSLSAPAPLILSLNKLKKKKEYTTISEKPEFGFLDSSGIYIRPTKKVNPNHAPT